ncbi:MAG: hypothetical protein WCY48_05530 [Candidatus Caldatribacteriota bacterium]
MGISTHPLKIHSQAFTAEMLGHMGHSREIGMGMRYTRDLDYFKRFDVAVSAGENSQSYLIGAGLEVEVLSEDIETPRMGIKGFYQYQKELFANYSHLGIAPNVSKGFSLEGMEFFPFLALPVGMKIDNASDEFIYSAALSAGVSVPVVRDILVNLELNRDLGASSDYIGLLISWMWN